MELASRIVSILLGVAVMVLLLWPVTIPLGFGEVWWASQKAQSQPEPPSPKREAPQPATPPASPPPQAEAQPPYPVPAQHAVEPAAGSPKPAQPPQAKAEHTAALNEKDKAGAPAPQTVTKLYYRVTVRDGGTLQSGGIVIRLSGIAARAADATCKSDNGKSWPCGAAAKAALTRLIRSRAVTCELPQSAQKDIAVRCSVAGADLSTWMVRQGWAEPKDAKEPAFAAAAEAAKQDRLGVWRGSE